MITIYEPKGPAREYAELALNLYRGCGNRCDYCYAPAVLRMERDDFGSGSVPRRFVIEELRRQIGKWTEMDGDGRARTVLMCFTSDPYPRMCSEVTREAIEVLGEAGLRPSVLTKNAGAAGRDFDLLEKYTGEFAVTLVFDDDALGARHEPGADCIGARYDTLRQAHEQGIYTWVSLEPVIDVGETFRILETCHEWVDQFRVGKLNYVRSGIDWARFGADIEERFRSLGVGYVLKKGLREAMRASALG